MFSPNKSEKAIATHSSTLAWKIPWVEEPGRLQSMGSQRVRHDWATSLSLFTFMHWRRKWQRTPVFLPGESQGWGRLMGCRLWGHAESDTDRSNFAAAAAAPNKYSFAQYIQKIKRTSVETDDQCYWNSIVNKLFLIMLFSISSLKFLVKIWFLSVTRYCNMIRTKRLKKWASLIAQLVKNLPAMQETLVRFLGQKNHLEKE